MSDNAVKDLTLQTVKPVIYQVFTRLFGNTNQVNIPWGTKHQNGVGKFSHFTESGLNAIKELGVTHIWFTGVLHHALLTDYRHYGIDLDDPDVVKGRAGSPFAIKDYYSVNPDLANDPANRLQEFEQLIARTHAAGMQVIIDLVPNHVARKYHSLTKPNDVKDFGEDDNTQVEYALNNNFYYLPGDVFKVPSGVIPLGGESHPLADVKFSETPAKWTGNGSRLPQPSANDWYDTVKLNFGVRPDGGADFPRLPNEYKHKDVNQHAQFWAEQEIPDTWLKFKHIAHFWLNKGVDGFRYDMAEMVPIEFWSFLNSSIKSTHHHAFTLAEVYNPARYRDFIHIGLMDHLYDKVEFYDALKGIMQQTAGTDKLELVQAGLQDIEAHMLHFLENHDEQRIASPEFAKDAAWGKPAMVVAALVSRSPTMLYFGQEVGEDGSEVAGFGKPSRTSIFDYIGVPAHQRWMNGGRFDGGQLNEKETKLRAFYQTVLRLSATHPAMAGEYVSLHSVNCWHQSDYDNSQFAFARWIDSNVLIVVSSFHATDSKYYELLLPNELIAHIGLQGYGLQDRGLEQQNLVNLVDRQYNVLDKLTQQQFVLQVSQGQGRIALTINPRSSLILEVKYD